MTFPEYKLANYQLQTALKTKYVMGGSAPAAMSLQQLLALAGEDELQQWQEFSLGYTPSRGSEDVREQIALMYPGLQADNILVTAGALEAIFIAYHALLKTNDLVQVVHPVFEPLDILAGSINANINSVHLSRNDEEGRWFFDLEEWMDKLHPQTRLATINFPHNPTGIMISQLQQQMMIEACRDYDVWLFSDEVFRGLEFSVSEKLPPIASVYEKGISLGVMSKALGLGGVRVGWLACQDKTLLKRMLKIKHFLSICVGRADEILSQIALNHKDEILQKNRELLVSNLALIDEVDSEINEKFKWYKPQAGCVAFPQLINGQSIREFARQLLDATGINIVPGDCFSNGDNHFRLGFGQQNFAEAFGLFTRFAQKDL